MVEKDLSKVREEIKQRIKAEKEGRYIFLGKEGKLGFYVVGKCARCDGRLLCMDRNRVWDTRLFCENYLKWKYGMVSEKKCDSGEEYSAWFKKESTKMNDKKLDVFEQFDSLLAQMSEIFKKKNHDYAGEDPFSNFRQSEKIGIPAWKGCMVRLGDKWSRLCQLAKKGEAEVKDETFEDTCLDLAIYALILRMLRSGKEK